MLCLDSTFDRAHAGGNPCLIDMMSPRGEKPSVHSQMTVKCANIYCGGSQVFIKEAGSLPTHSKRMKCSTDSKLERN